ncbi:MAG: nSTAND1 domain-containing NTPase [Anaerolineales bacterium]
MTEEVSPGISDQPENQINQSGGVNFGTYNVLDIKGNIIGTLNGYTYEQVMELIAELRSQEQAKVFSGRPPYLGLVTYQESDTDLFFGREELLEKLLSRLAGERFLCLSGPSGSGKSSLVRAGVIPALRKGLAIPGSDKWLIRTLTPGNQPIESLAKAMAAMASQVGQSFQFAGDHVRENGKIDAKALSTLIDLFTQDGGSQQALIVVDQFEEVFAENRDKVEQDAFIAQLIYAVQAENGNLNVILTLRSDFLSHTTSLPGLNQLINQGIQLIGAMDSSELARAITLPAIQEGVEVEPELVEKVISEMLGEPGALPLMQFTLRDLFDRQNPKQGEPVKLTLNEYLQSGGVWEALSRHADKALSEIGSENQKTARQVFTRLVEIGANQADTRRTATTAELIAIGVDPTSLEHFLSVMTKARLIVAQGEQSGGSGDRRSISLAHDRLIHDWPWLKALVNENREAIALVSQLEAEANQWKRHKGEGSYLLSGKRLISAQDRLADKDLALSPLGQKFLEESIQQDQAYQRQIKVNQMRDSIIRGLIGGGVGFGMAFLLAFWPQLGSSDLILLIFGMIFMAASGAFAGLFLAGSVQALNSWSERFSRISSLAISGLVGAVAFSVPVMINYLLFAAPFEMEPAILILLEASLWGFAAGVSIYWSVSSSRPVWQILSVVGFICGLVLMFGELAADGFAIPDRIQVVGEPESSPEPLPWLIFIVGALVPVLIAGAMRYKRVLSNETS